MESMNASHGSSRSEPTLHTGRPYETQASAIAYNMYGKLHEEVILGYIGLNSSTLGGDLEANLANSEQLYIIKCKLNGFIPSV